MRDRRRGRSRRPLSAGRDGGREEDRRLEQDKKRPNPKGELLGGSLGLGAMWRIPQSRVTKKPRREDPEDSPEEPTAGCFLFFDYYPRLIAYSNDCAGRVSTPSPAARGQRSPRGDSEARLRPQPNDHHGTTAR